MAAVPVINQPGVEALLGSREKALVNWNGHCLVLVHGSYEPGARTEFKLSFDGNERIVRVTDQPSVLGIAAAWSDHQDSAPDSGVLVVTTRVDDAELDWDLRGHALETRTLTVDPDEILKQRFGAGRLDSRVWQAGWLVEALLAAEPAKGWPRRGGVLTYEAAMVALVEQRLGVEATTLDLDRLLDWSRSTGGPARWRELTDAERAGIEAWLVDGVGPAVEPLLALVEAGRGHDAMALGLIGTALDDRSLPPDALMAVGGLFPGMRPEAVRSFAAAVDGTLSRWISVAEQESRSGDSPAFTGVLGILKRADELAGTAGLGDALSRSTLLPSGLIARIRAVGSALPDPAAATAAWRELGRHRLAGLYDDQVRAAEMAVRLARWLAIPDSQVDSVADGARRHVAEWGWIDYAITVLWAGDATVEPVSANAYQDLCHRVVSRRSELDRAFAHRLTGWVPNATAQTPQGVLLVEDVLSKIVAPLAEKRSPLIVVLDGMSGAVSAQLGDELSRRQNWVEASPEPGRRQAAVSVIPSVTKVSRVSLLSGRLAAGGQSVEKDGFARFWKSRRKQARLFHENEVGGVAGQRLNSDVISALSGDEVVCVVVNTIDDALGPGREGAGASWQLADIRFLPELLTQASSYGRPVVLVADHGHVLERGVATGPAPVLGDHGARWRTGDATEGEVELRGPRVLEGDGQVVVPWREDIRYTQKHAGYHGGASLAEMTVPILVLLPALEALPTRWAGLTPEQVRPSWWQEPSDPVEIPAKPPRTRPKPVPQGPTLFDAPLEAPAPVPLSLGQRVVATDVYQSQKAFVRKAPDSKVVAGLIDAIEAAGGRISLAAVAATAGRAARNIDGFLATVQRLLNVEQYPVFEPIDAGRTVALDVALLREQFGLGTS